MSASDSTTAPKPAIVAPVMRQLVVADVDRSISFYREVLGFEPKPVTPSAGFQAAAELASGPARIQLGPRGGEPEARAVVHFQISDVAAMRTTVQARGGAPSELAKVNWLKVRMFEIKDPDGNTLWFGQSYHEIGPRPRPARNLRQALPNLPLSDVPAGVAYYRDVLGFKVNYAQDDLGVMDRDDITIILIARTEAHRGIGSCYVYVDDADRLYAELLASGARVQNEPISLPWGLREFRIRDLEGNEIGFGQTFE